MFEFERISSISALRRAWKRIMSKEPCAGIDGVSLSLYQADLERNLRSLQCSIVSGSYAPVREKLFLHKNREIGICCIDDKIVQTVLAEVIGSLYTPNKSVHGFVKNRSIFTAKKELAYAMDMGISEFCKIDVRRFYDSIDKDLLFRKIEHIIPDTKFLKLVEKLLNSHSKGISTGSCLSPTLSNLYLSDFDNTVLKNSLFYSRYCDDMLVAPQQNITLVRDELAGISLEINAEKSVNVDTSSGFKYLGFDIKRKIDEAIQRGDFTLAEQLHEVSESDVSTVPKKQTPQIDGVMSSEVEVPAHILHVEKKCHIVSKIVEKAKEQKYINFAEKTALLQIFHCLGEDGAEYIHHVLSCCIDYDFAETARQIKRYNLPNPIGCRKLAERFDEKDKCTCNFSKEKMYPSPIIHARRKKSDCFIPPETRDNIGHFKTKTPQHKMEDALSSLLELNKKAYEICEQQNVFKGQIESLFARNNISEIRTPQGLLIKSDDGIFIKVG